MMNRTKTPQRRGSLFFALLAFTFISLFSLPVKVNAQIFKKLDNGVADTVVASCTDSNYLYVVYRTRYNLPDSVTYQVARWDGISWYNYPEYTLKAVSMSFWESNEFNSYITTIQIYKGHIYLAGKLFETFGKNPYILKLENNSWDTIPVPGNFYQSPNTYWCSLTNFKDKLYLVGEENIQIWDGSNWKAAKNSGNENLIDRSIHFESINSVYASKDYLYIGGNFSMIDSIKIKAIAKWDGTKWSTETNDFENVTDLKWFRNKLYIYGSLIVNGIVKTGIAVKESNSNWKFISDSIFYKASHYLITSLNRDENTLNYLIYHADSNWKFSRSIFSWDGSSWNKTDLNFTFNQNSYAWAYFRLNSYKNKLVLSGGFKNINSDTVNYIAEFNFNANTNISGYVFQDQNSDCIKSTLEEGIANNIIKITPGSYYLSTDANGNFSYPLEPGNYTLTALPKKYQKQTCPSQSAPIKLTILPDSTYSNIIYGFEPIPGITDIKVNLTSENGFRARPGFTERFTLNYENSGTAEVDSGSIILGYDNYIKKLVANPLPDMSGTKFLNWKFKNLKPGEKRSISFNAKIDSLAKLNDSLNLFAYTDEFINSLDTFKKDNIDTLKQRITGAFDPNDKQVFPYGNITPETRELKFHIRFQNTGNDTAYNVVIKDLIDPSINIENIEIIGTSHNFNYSVIKNVLEISFPNILLPDSNTNEPLSHGYISYKVKLKDSLAIGTEIRNTAYIYFDFQPAVITNTTLNTIRTKAIVTAIQNEETKQINPGLKIYPNPAISAFFIENTSSERQNLRLINMMGQIVNIYQVNAGEKVTIDASLLPIGLYFIKSTDNENSAAMKVLIQH